MPKLPIFPTAEGLVKRSNACSTCAGQSSLVAPTRHNTGESAIAMSGISGVSNFGIFNVFRIPVFFSVLCSVGSVG